VSQLGVRPAPTWLREGSGTFKGGTEFFKVTADEKPGLLILLVFELYLRSHAYTITVRKTDILETKV
jgi:hypothetical protein